MEAVCLSCKNTWAATAPAGAQFIECPSCDLVTNRFRKIKFKEIKMINWKTTAMGIAGFLLAGATAKGWVTADQSAGLLALIVGILGYLAKDKDVTGGTREQ
jgi:hypothetical protein